MMELQCIDFETTGVDDGTERICEVGFFRLSRDINGNRQLKGGGSHLVNPGCRITPESSAIHHIIDEDVVDALKPEDVIESALATADVIVAHNADYEKKFIVTDKSWICTYKVACRALTELKSHRLQYLRYALNLEVDRDMALPAHRAGPDAYVTAYLLHYLMDYVPIERMFEWSKMPALVPFLDFGMHKGMRYSEVAKMEPHYLQFILETDFGGKTDERHYTAAHWLRNSGDDDGRR